MNGKISVLLTKWTPTTHAQERGAGNWRNTCHVTVWAKWSGSPTVDQKYCYKTGKNELKNRKGMFGIWLYNLRSFAVVLLSSPIPQLSSRHILDGRLCYPATRARLPEGFFQLKITYLKTIIIKKRKKIPRNTLILFQSSDKSSRVSRSL